MRASMGSSGSSAPWRSTTQKTIFAFNAICPGSMNTPLTDTIPEEKLAPYRNANLMKRFAEPIEVGAGTSLSGQRRSLICDRLGTCGRRRLYNSLRLSSR